MSVIRLEMTELQALDVIRDLQRAVVLLDQSGQRLGDKLHQAACIRVGNSLTDLAEDLDNACRGIEGPAVRRRG